MVVQTLCLISVLKLLSYSVSRHCHWSAKELMKTPSISAMQQSEGRLLLLYN